MRRKEKRNWKERVVWDSKIQEERQKNILYFNVPKPCLLVFLVDVYFVR
jgi:hypothetical protein